MVYSQTQLLEKSGYLVELLGKDHEPMLHLKAAIFVQPTDTNLTSLVQELRNPKFAEYHLFFSNIVSSDTLSTLAREDVNEVVKQVHEYYADFIPINEDFFQIGATGSISLSSPIRNLKTDQIFERNVNGLLSVLLATKKKPCQVRYQASSDLARRIANDVVTHIESDGIFVFQTQGPILLILDRRDDPITPLLTQWTYQAMVHELLGNPNLVF
jgi:vacuolar protein sorting-associated protein 45